MKNTIFIKANQMYHRIDISDIDWCQSDGNYATLKVLEKKYLLKKSLTNIIRELPTNSFIQVHKRYLINLTKIEKVDTLNSVVYIGGITIPIGRTYKNELLEKLNFI